MKSEDRMLVYESGIPTVAGTSPGVCVEITNADVRRWNDRDATVIKQAECCALVNGLKMKKIKYFIKGVGGVFLTNGNGTIEALRLKYPKITEDSTGFPLFEMPK